MIKFFLTISIILISSSNLLASDPVIVDTTGMDFQNYWYTGTFGQQIVVDDSGKIHVCYNKTWCTETDTGWQVMYANVTDGIKIPILSQEPKDDIQPGIVYLDGGQNGSPIYFYYSLGSRFRGHGLSYHVHAMAKLNQNGKNIVPLGLAECHKYCYNPYCQFISAIEIEVDNVNGIAHCILSTHSDKGEDKIGTNIGYWNFDGTNFGEIYQMLIADPVNDIPGKDVPEKYRRNGTKGVDIAVSAKGDKVAIATLHTNSNIFLHTATYKGELWPDNFFTGLSNGSIIALFDTTNSATGDNIPNNAPKPFTEVQISYDENDNLHVVYDATYIDSYFDTSVAVSNLKHWWDNNLYGSAGDTNAVFYDGSVHPKPQIRYWNSISKTHTLLAECSYPVAGESFKWFSYGDPIKSAASWGKFINDSPIANIEFLINKNPQNNEPKLVCVWEEMQGGVTPLTDKENNFGYTYYAYRKDIKISISEDGNYWTAPYNVTRTPNRDESDVSVYRDIIDNKIYMLYYEDSFPGCDLNLSYVDSYEDKFIKNWPPINNHDPVPIRKETTEQVNIVYKDFDLSTITGVNSFEKNYPEKFDLAQNYPNPFNPVTTISYTVPAGHIKLEVYNALGQKIRTLVDRNMPAGSHQVVWDGMNEGGKQVSTGIYICKIKSEAGVKTRKMLLQK